MPSPYTSTICLWISTSWTFLAFKNLITYCTLQVAGFFMFAFILNEYSKWRNNFRMILRHTHVPLDAQKTTDLNRKH
jgi:hypothetical protein